MILDEFLKVAKFGTTSITVPQDKARTYFKFLRQALLDGHIPVHKVIGYVTRYTSPSHNKGGRKPVDDYPARIVNREWKMGDAIAATRDLTLGECNFDLNERFLHILLKPQEFPIIYTSTEVNGPIPSTELQYPQSLGGLGLYNFTSRLVKGSPQDHEGEYGRWITENDYFSPDYGPWFTYLGNSNEFQLYLYLIESTGYKDANETHNYLPKSGELNEIETHWFPFDQNFNMSEFVRVKPLRPNSNVIELSLQHRMTIEFLQERLHSWCEKYSNNSLSAEEVQWLQHFN